MVSHCSLTLLYKLKKSLTELKLQLFMLVCPWNERKQSSWRLTSKVSQRFRHKNLCCLLEEAQDFKYFGAWVKRTEQDVKTRKPMTWKACNNLSKLWKSNLSNDIKIKLFQATVEKVLLYGSEPWAVTRKIGKALDGCYNRMLRAALDISWKSHITNNDVYGDLPKLATKITKRRLQFAGHCKRRKSSTVSSLITWRPTQEIRKAERPTKPYVNQL